MQFIIPVAALVAIASATNSQVSTHELNSSCDKSKAHVKIVNRCSYPVYLWSIDKELGCSEDSAFELKTGGLYNENYRAGTNGGISLKMSKTDTCGGKDITQLEYKIETTDERYQGNYLDMSFVDCTTNLEDCPGRTDGFYLKSGNDDGAYVSAVDNQHCPIFNVYNAEEAAKVSYINWDDPQTKYCDRNATLSLYLCGGDAPDADDDYSPVPVSSAAPSSSQIKTSSSAPSSSPKPSSSAPVASSSSTEEGYVVAAAAVTEAPEVPSPSAPVVKTEVVYVTQYVKRHAHARRHQHFHA